jgi:HEAT repeat protein
MILHRCERIFRPLMYLLGAMFIVCTGRIYAADDSAKIKADLNSRDWQVRMTAVESLSNSKDENTIDLLMQVAEMRGEYWPVKIKAIQFLGEAANPKSLNLLLSIFNDPFNNWECPSIKSYTALALGNFKGNDKVVDSLINGLTDRELFTREASIQALGKIGNPKAVPSLIGLLQDNSAAVKLSAIKALELIGDTQAIPHLQRVADNDADPLIKSEAKAALNNVMQKSKSSKQ